MSTPEDTEREAILERLRAFAAQQSSADELADSGSLARAADLMALYEERGPDGRRRFAAELPPPAKARNRGRPVDPESFSRFTKWLVDQVPLKGSRAYQLRDAHDLATNYFHRVEIIPDSERALRPLKWLVKNGHSDHVSEVWEAAVRAAGGRAPDSATVRRALADWRRINIPKASRPTTPRGGKDTVDRWLRDARRIMQEYPELFIDAVNTVEAEAEKYFTREKAAA
jgi:hypothetical protein